jgi:multidrug efflux pump subunit AcrA (membrane-fusion protein)
VLLSFDSLGGQVYQGKVATIAPRIDNATKSFKIKVDVTDEVRLQPGMSAELNILQSERTNVLLIPVSAIVGNHVFIVQNERATLRTIKTGIRDNNKAEIMECLEKGDLVILNPANIQDGDSVSVIKK